MGVHRMQTGQLWFAWEDESMRGFGFGSKVIFVSTGSVRLKNVGTSSYLAEGLSLRSLGGFDFPIGLAFNVHPELINPWLILIGGCPIPFSGGSPLWREPPPPTNGTVYYSWVNMKWLGGRTRFMEMVALFSFWGWSVR